MVLRNVPQTDTFEQQRVEINEIAADLHALDTNVGSLTLDDLTGVNANNPTQDQILKFNGTEWVLDTDILSTNFSVTIAAASGGGSLGYVQATGVFTYTPPDLSGFLTTVALPNLSDVTISNLQTDQILKYNGTAWVNDSFASTQVSDINDIGNVTITNVQNNQVLKYNGTAWVNDSGGTTSFVALHDTPVGFQAGKWLKVNAAANGLEWTDAPSDNNTTYSQQLTVANATPASVQWDLVPSVGTADSITLTAGTNVTFSAAGADGVTINASGGGGGSTTLGGLTDVNISGTPTVDSVLKYKAAGVGGAGWYPDTDTGNVQSNWAATTGDAVILNKPTIPGALNDLSDVSTTGAANGKILKHNGTSWVVADDVSGSSTANTTTSDTAPGSPTDGDLWWKSDEGRLKIYYADANSSQWVDANPPLQSSGGSGGGATVTTDDNAPSNPSDGDLWFKTDEAQLKIYYDDGTGSPSAQWVDAGGGGTGIALSDLSVGTEGTASGDGSIGYNNSTGVFTYTPPVIPAAQVQSDWNATTGLGVILNKPSIPTNTFVGLTDTPVGFEAGKWLKVNAAANGLEWTDAPSDNNTTYSQSSVANAANVNLRLTGSDSTNDDILVTAGNNITFSSVTAAGFTINSTSLSVSTGTASGGGALSYNNTTGVFSFTPAEQTTIIGNADNRVITGSATAGTLNGESGLTYNGTALSITGNVTATGDSNSFGNTTIVGAGGAGGVALKAEYSSSSIFEVSNLGNMMVTGSISDSGGNVRKLPNNNKTAAYTIAATDVGSLVNTNNNVTIPQSIFNSGDAITIYNNNTNSDITITQGTGVTMYLCGQATSGNRTLAKTGICTVVCVSTNTFVISGAGLT